MRKVLIMLLLPFFSLITLYGQTEKLCGIILDETDGMPVPRATVRLTDVQGRLLNYTFAAEDGSFTIKYDHSQTELTVHVQSMGYRSQNFVLKPSMSPVTIRLQAEPTRLRDVIVKAPDIEQRSDTLVYYTSKYARKQDRNIGDVLKRLPGIEVEDNGTIKYNGEPINKFYINGSDFADGRYNLATENNIAVGRSQCGSYGEPSADTCIERVGFFAAGRTKYKTKRGGPPKMGRHSERRNWGSTAFI